MRAGNLAPDDADPGAADLLLGLVDVGDALAEVELGLVGLLDTLDLDERGVALGDALRALVTHNATLDVKTRLRRCCKQKCWDVVSGTDGKRGVALNKKRRTADYAESVATVRAG